MILGKRWVFLIVILFCVYYWFQPTWISANSYIQINELSTVTIEIRYSIPEVDKVYLVWGINDWQVLPIELQPLGTETKDKVMHTPMVQAEDGFIVRLEVPIESVIDYGFLVEKNRNTGVVKLWDGNNDQNYKTKATQNDVVEVQSKLTIIDAPSTKVMDDPSLPFVVGMSFLFAVGTILIWRRRSSLGFLSNYAWQITYLRDLLHALVIRDLKLRYKRSVLGIAWSLLNPLAQLLVFYFVFSYVLPLDIPNFAIFLFVGILVWNWFQTSLFSATGIIVDNPDLIRRPGFPVAILPVVTVITHLIHFILAIPVLVFFLTISKIPFSSTLVYLPLLMVLQSVLILSLSYFVAAIHVNFRDTQYLLGIVLLLGFYLSPVFYDLNIIPQEYHIFYRLNPMVDLITAFRSIFMEGQLPSLFPLMLIGIFSFLTLWVGYRFFIQASYRFVEEL